jgi:MGT family glycosyltransferase
VYNYAEDLNIVFVPRAFQTPGPDFDERFVFVGPSFLPQTGSSPITRRADRPTLYISLGTLFNDWPEFFAMCFAAFGNSSWQVLISIGDQIDPAQLGAVPENITIAASVPQRAVLAETDVFITHGGMNSVMESLACAVPLVVIPQMAEQAVTARRVADLELGIALDKYTISVESLRDAASRVLNEPSFRHEAAKMQAAIRESGGYRQAADEIISYSATRLQAPAALAE